ncbi:MAG TPA: hypothetical protein VE028_13805 [Nitratidesulfovibrio sp.]|nr:hypothetical protein [Nitratidesulfovibrio sp.]
MPVPAIAHLDTFNELATKASEGELSEFELAQLERVGKLLLKSSPPNGHTALGIVACLKGDIKRAIREHKASLASAPGDPTMLANYSRTLAVFEKFDEAYELMLQAVLADRTNTSLVSTLALYAYNAADMENAAKWAHEYRKLTQKPCTVEFWLDEDAEDEAELNDIKTEAESSGYTDWSLVKSELGL